MAWQIQIQQAEHLRQQEHAEALRGLQKRQREMEAALQACNEMRRRDNNPTLPKAGMTTISEGTTNTASPASIPLKVLPSIDSISSIQSQGQTSSTGVIDCLDDQARKAAGTRGYMDDRATPPLYPTQMQGGLSHPVPPLHEVLGAVAGLAHQNSPVALFNRWNKS